MRFLCTLAMAGRHGHQSQKVGADLAFAFFVSLELSPLFTLERPSLLTKKIRSSLDPPCLPAFFVITAFGGE